MESEILTALIGFLVLVIIGFAIFGVWCFIMIHRWENEWRKFIKKNKEKY